MRLLFIRHGQTPANVLGQLDTAHPGPGLTDLGLEQAARIPEALSAEPIDALFASTLVRTQITAAPLAVERGLAVTVLGGIHEIEAGTLEKRSDPESVRGYLETVFAWGAGNLDVEMPGNTNGHHFFGRFDSDISEIVASGAETAAVVSHGAAIRVWVARHARNVSPVFAGQHDLMNTGIVVVEGSFDDGWSLTEWQGTPIGGSELSDATAADPTGETLTEARDDTRA
ncbi:MAG: histidine phosphatase family protein [Microbacteriaceae bacterium]|nr:histidine phosphatase family protein [Microbacteriaceae bacterium]